MRVIHDLDEMTQTARGWLAGGSVAFVPIMGNLHQGHLALVQAAQQECDICVVCLLVNSPEPELRKDLPTSSYDLTRDIQLLSTTNIDVVFIPRLDAMYPPHFVTYVI